MLLFCISIKIYKFVVKMCLILNLLTNWYTWFITWRGKRHILIIISIILLNLIRLFTIYIIFIQISIVFLLILLNNRWIIYWILNIKINIAFEIFLILRILNINNLIPQIIVLFTLIKIFLFIWARTWITLTRIIFIYLC